MIISLNQDLNFNLLYHASLTSSITSNYS